MTQTSVVQNRSQGPLTADALAHFDRTGWVPVPGFFSADETSEISDWVDEMLTRPEVPGTHWVYRQPSLLDPSKKTVQRIENFCPYHAGLNALAHQSRLHRATEQVLDGPVFLFKEKINYKQPGGTGFEMHQDQQAGWTRYAPLFVTVMVCIDPATVENGCLEMADGLPRLDHLIADEWRPIDEKESAGISLPPIPTMPGDVAFFDSYIPHASKANLSSKGRRLMFFTYNRQVYGDQRDAYHADKRAACPPDSERAPGKDYVYKI